MDFVTPLLGIIDTSYSFVATRVNHVRKFRRNMNGLMTKLELLKNAKDDLKQEVYLAELAGMKSTNQVAGWLKVVEKAETEVNDLIRAQATHQAGKCCSRQSGNVTWYTRYKLSKKSLKKDSEISELMASKPIMNVVAGDLRQVEVIPSNPTWGLAATLETAISYIADDNVGILGIYGMGGVGKTTLLKEINNEYLSRPHDFEVVIWVSVSKDFGVDRIQCSLLSRLGLSWDENESQMQLSSRIHSLMSSIKFLLLLDDLWQGLVFEDIGIPLPNKENKCKVVFTTRSTDVCCDMDASKTMKVEFLNEEDSWQLFREKVGETNAVDSCIESYKQAIVRKCGGLPLALITAGRAMANKKTEEEWKYSLEALNNAPSELRGMGNVFSVLKFSYDNLSDDSLKMCFLYCALFPEEFPLEKEQLIDYWIGEGFLDGENNNSLHYKGHAFIGSLNAACLLETGEEENQVKMHDVVRSFAIWVVSNGGKNKEKFVVQGCNGLSETPNVEKWKEAERISLLDNEISMLTGNPICPNLSTLLLNWNCSLNKITCDFFHYMPSLKVLDLSVTTIREIPKSIGQLVELRFLDLSRTNITSLPNELGCLSKLRHMDLQRTHLLKTIPREAILRLSNLRVLNMYYSYGEWESPTPSLEMERRKITFSDLQCLKHLTALGITVAENSALKELSGFDNLLDCIHYLFIKGCQGLRYLMVASADGGGEKVRRVSIYNCDTLEEIDLGSDEGIDWLPSLEVLSLHTLPNLRAIWRKSVTPRCHRNLRYIKIWFCPNLKNISWILQLPKLEKLYVFHCEEMEEIIGENDIAEGTEELHFPQLKIISFRGLSKLRSFSKVVLNSPVLQSIAVIDCPELKKLPFMCHCTSDLPTVHCSRNWWMDLEWDNYVSASSLVPQFIAV
ncbi:disease resistance protein RPS2-like [Silene latifolia]|uniref:disease resistance protein RPS2-like n=1 Tax=Silene latifolia TaxID=37657 RepID=UPI003D78856B